MKIVKFKAWHLGKMYDVNTLGIKMTGINKGLSFAHKEFQSKEMEEDAVIFTETTEFMQFIGEYDKNGIEIYEGYIKRWQFNDSDRYSVCYWSEIDCGFRWKLIKHNETQANFNHDILFDTEEDFYDYVIGCNQRENGFDSWSTIVGNIHENPELL